MRIIIVSLLIGSLVAPLYAQDQPPPPPLDATQLYAHIVFIESRIESLSQQLRDAHAEELAKDAQLSAQVTAMHEIIVVQANKPSWIGELLSNRTFWESVSALVAAAVIYIERK